MTVRLIASDIDGTLLHDDGAMSDRTAAALAAAEEAGILVVLCTGRPPRWMKPIAEQTGHHGVAICANGALVYDLHTEQVVEELPLDADVARTITTALRAAHPEVTFAVERAAGMTREASYVRILEDAAVETELESLLREPMAKLLVPSAGAPASSATRAEIRSHTLTSRSGSAR